MKKRFITSLLALFMGVTSIFACACGGGASKNDQTDSSVNGSTGNTTGGAQEDKKDFEESGYNLVANGKSDYVIVIPEEADKNLNFAATEINNFIKQASTVNLNTVKDANASKTAKYISLGDTQQLAETDVTVDESYGETGHLIKTIDGNVYVVANTTYGVLFGIYDLLEYLIDLEIYAEDEYDYEEKSVIPVYDFNETFIPLLDSRHVTYRSVETSYIYRARMGLHSIGEEWVSFCHTTISVFLPATKYAAEHKDWYNAMQDQLCYTNEEMRVEFVNQLKEHIKKNPDRKYISIGQEDNLNYCDCKNCMKYINSHGGIDGGGYSCLQLEFVNKCAEETDAWLAQAYPGKTLKYVCFAYQTTENAPVVYDEATKKYVPNNPDIRVHENVNILFCPIYADFSLSMKHEANGSTYNNMVKWNNLLVACNAPNNLMIYTYCIACKALMIPFPNFGMSSDHYQTFAELGVKYVFDQNFNASGLAAFEGLKIYTQTREMMYKDCDYNALAKDFIDHYYGEARVQINNYYNSLRAWLSYLQKEQDYSGKISFDTCQQGFWPIDVLQKFIGYIDEGFKEIEPLKTSNPERYQVLYDRLKREKLFPQWLMFYFYQDYMDRDTQLEYMNDLEVYTAKYMITQSAEGNANVASLLAGWKALIGK